VREDKVRPYLKVGRYYYPAKSGVTQNASFKTSTVLYVVTVLYHKHLSPDQVWQWHGTVLANCKLPGIEIGMNDRTALLIEGELLRRRLVRWSDGLSKNRKDGVENNNLGVRIRLLGPTLPIYQGTIPELRARWGRASCALKSTAGRVTVVVFTYYLTLLYFTRRLTGG
jgi:hypothetical protein